MMEDKTNAMRLLDARKAKYAYRFFESPVALSGAEVARALGEPVERVYKTLVTVGKSGAHYVFVVPALKELELKLAAKSVNEKYVEMIKERELLPLTGYIHGGCSPVGMKKAFRTVIDISASGGQAIFVSGGRLGCQLEISPDELQKAIRFTFAALTL